jgi:hypothetical protein
MRRLVIVGLLVALGSCADPVGDAQQELAILEKSGAGRDEICGAKRKVADAYLKAHNEAEFKKADLSADIACNSAAIDRLR